MEVPWFVSAAFQVWGYSFFSKTVPVTYMWHNLTAWNLVDANVICCFYSSHHILMFYITKFNDEL